MSEQNKEQKFGWVWAIVVGGVILSLILACIVGGLAGFFAGRFAARSTSGTIRNLSPGSRLPGIQIPQPNLPDVNPNVTPLAPNLNRLRVAGAAVVVEVTAGGPAEKAGLKVGDIISRVDDVRLTGSVALSDLIARHKPGDEITLTLGATAGQNRTVKVTLGEHPDDATRAYLGIRYSQFSVPDTSEQPGNTN